MKKAILLFLFVNVLTCVYSQTNLRELVVPVDWTKFKTEKVNESDFMKEIRYLLTQSNRYGLNTWYNDLNKFSEQKGEYLDFGGKTEHFIRPVSHEAFTLALSLKLGIYDEKITGVPDYEALKKIVKLIKSAAFRHKVNSGVDGWGDQWQSALWASQIAEAAWLVWDKLNSEEQEIVCRMMVHEADRFIEYTVPYYRDFEGNIIYKGDTKAEENAWNSNILTIATVMMPEHPNYEKWMKKNIELQLSAYAAPDDIHRDLVVDGLQLNKFLKGSNINDDGTVINHNIVHPDYMVAFMHNATNVWIYALGCKNGLKSSVFNGERIYQAMTELKFDGKTICVRTQDGKPTSEMYFPQGNDWGTGRQDNYWLMDIMASIFGWDKQSDIKAMDWAKVRNVKMLEMIARNKTGQYYMDDSENSFKSREPWFGAQIAFGYLGLWLQQQGLANSFE